MKQYSYEHMIKVIRLLYENRGFLRPELTIGQTIYKEYNNPVIDAQLGGLFAYLDEFIALHRYISYFFITGIGNKNSEALTYYRLSIRQIHNLSSIRLLCSYGLDYNARLQLRNLYETSLLWVRCTLDQDFMVEYQKSVTTIKTNEFWHKYLSKGKNETKIKELLKSKKSTWIVDLDNNLEHFKSIMSIVSHPNYIADHYAGIEDWNNYKDDKLATFPISSGSHFTLSNALLCSAIPFTVTPFIEYKIEFIDLRESLEFPKTSSQLNINEYFHKLTELIPALLLASFKCANELRTKEL